MRILSVSATLEEFPLTRPYAIAQQEPTTRVDNVIVRIEALSGPVGWGAASPAENVTGETVAACREALSAERLAWLVGRDVRTLPALCRELARTDAGGARRARRGGHGAARPARAAPRRSAGRDAGPRPRRAADLDHDRHQAPRRDARRGGRVRGPRLPRPQGQDGRRPRGGPRAARAAARSAADPGSRFAPTRTRATRRRRPPASSRRARPRDRVRGAARPARGAAGPVRGALCAIGARRIAADESLHDEADALAPGRSGAGVRHLQHQADEVRRRSTPRAASPPSPSGGRRADVGLHGREPDLASPPRCTPPSPPPRRATSTSTAASISRATSPREGSRWSTGECGPPTLRGWGSSSILGRGGFRFRPRRPTTLSTRAEGESRSSAEARILRAPCSTQCARTRRMR